MREQPTPMLPALGRSHEVVGILCLEGDYALNDEVTTDDSASRPAAAGPGSLTW